MSAPASASARAMACPIPLVPPVTMAVLPLSENREDIVADMVVAVVVVVVGGDVAVECMFLTGSEYK